MGHQAKLEHGSSFNPPDYKFRWARSDSEPYFSIKGTLPC